MSEKTEENRQQFITAAGAAFDEAVRIARATNKGLELRLRVCVLADGSTFGSVVMHAESQEIVLDRSEMP